MAAERFVEALNAIIHENATVEQAARHLGVSA